MYKNAKTSVKFNRVGGRDFPVEVGVHQGVHAQSSTLYYSYGSAVQTV